MMEDDQISFRSASSMFDEIEDYSHQIAEMIGIKKDNFIEAGVSHMFKRIDLCLCLSYCQFLICYFLSLLFQVRTVLDIGCGYGSFGAHLLSKQILTMCIANYESSGSQVQLTLERGLPAMIASFMSKQLPYPSLSFDMLHCSRCGIDWDLKGNILMTPKNDFSHFLYP